MRSADCILLVEDKDSLRSVLRKTLEAEGFGVEEAPDGGIALEKIRRDRFAMILTDLRLPAASGHDVLKAAIASDPEMPVIMMTAYGTIKDAVSAMKAGAYDYLEKPVDADHLLALVRRALDHRSLVQENAQLKERFSQELHTPPSDGCARPSRPPSIADRFPAIVVPSRWARQGHRPRQLWNGP